MGYVGKAAAIQCGIHKAAMGRMTINGEVVMRGLESEIVYRKANHMKNKKRVLFTLSMPTVSSWNGKWSGEGIPYRKRMEVPAALADKVLQNPYYSYRFSDGWVAGISVEELATAEQWRNSRKTCGFCGYDWMINSILAKQEISYDK